MHIALDDTTAPIRKLETQLTRVKRQQIQLLSPIMEHVNVPTFEFGARPFDY